MHASLVAIYAGNRNNTTASEGACHVEKDDRGLFEAMLHRLQIMRQESEQQTALLRQMCQAIDGLGLEIGRLSTTVETVTGAADGHARKRRSANGAQPALGSLSAQAALAKDMLGRAHVAALSVSGKTGGK